MPVEKPNFRPTGIAMTSIPRAPRITIPAIGTTEAAKVAMERSPNLPRSTTISTNIMKSRRPDFFSGSLGRIPKCVKPHPRNRPIMALPRIPPVMALVYFAITVAAAPHRLVMNR
jgi:hypothetical protein